MKTVTEAFPHIREQANDIKMIVFLSFEKESSMRYKKKRKKKSWRCSVAWNVDDLLTAKENGKIAGGTVLVYLFERSDLQPCLLTPWSGNGSC